MKKIAVALVLCLIVAGGLFAQSFTVDLSKLPAVRNPEPIDSPYGLFKVNFPDGTFPADLDWRAFNRIRVVYQYFRANGAEIRQGNNNAMVVFAYDPEGDLAGPPQGPGPNTPIKIFNVGGANGSTRPSGEDGAPISIARAPGCILLQRQGPDSPVRFIELKEITFFRQ